MHIKGSGERAIDSAYDSTTIELVGSATWKIRPFNMTRHQLTQLQRGIILAYHSDQYQSKVIADILDRHRSTIDKFLKRYAERGSAERKKGSGGQFKLTTRD